MTLPLWPFLALGFSFCGALIVGFNHYAKIPGAKLVVLRLAGVLPLTALSALILPWPHDPLFYGVAALMGILLAFSDKLLFDASAVHGGRLASLYIPMKMLVGFVLWGLLAPQSVTMLLGEWWRVALVVAGFAFCSHALWGLRKHETSRTAIMAVVPVALLLALGDVVAKSALGGPEGGIAHVIGSATAFLTVTTSVGSLVGMAMAGKFRPTLREVVLSALFGALLMAGLSVFLVSLALAPNPGYVGAITMLSSLWLALHGYFHHGERANWWHGVLLLGGAICVAVGAA